MPPKLVLQPFFDLMQEYVTRIEEYARTKQYEQMGQTVASLRPLVRATAQAVKIMAENEREGA